MERIKTLLKMELELDPIRPAIIQQRIWRQKQIDIFYKTGRPIFIMEEYKNRFFYKWDYDQWDYDQWDYYNVSMTPIDWQ